LFVYRAPGRLSDAEREVLTLLRRKFSKDNVNNNWTRFVYFMQSPDLLYELGLEIKKNNINLSV